MRNMQFSHMALAVLCLLMLSACGGGAVRNSGELNSNNGPDLNPGAGFTGLPDVSELAGRSAAFTEAGLVSEGADFQPGLPSQGVTAAGTAALFAPVGELGMGSAALAFAVYSFDVDGYDRDLSVRLTWDTAPSGGNAWLALANFSTGQWNWLEVPATNIVEFSNLANYTSPAPANLLYAAVLTGGTATATLDRLRVGTQPEAGAPNADLQADTLSGPPPLTVNFDAGGSTAASPASIMRYEFDFGAGGGFQDLGTNPLAQHQYTANGIYSAMVRVTDIFGAQDTASLTIDVGYDEIEPNNDMTEAQQLPALPFAGFRGSIGNGLDYPGYDGGLEDYFLFSATGLSNVELTLDFADPMGTVFMSIMDPVSSAIFDTASTINGQASLRFDFLGGEPDPLALVLFSTDFGDYTISAAPNVPTAVLTATPLGGPLPLLVTLDAGSSTPVAPATIASYEFDPEGTGNFSTPQPNADYDHTYSVVGVYSARVRVTDSNGVSSIASTHVLAGVSFDEVEPNNGIPEANPLPLLPVFDYTGSLGSGPGYPGYDGGSEDYFSFTASSGDAISLELEYDNTNGELFLTLLDSAGGFYDFAEGSGGRASLAYTLNGAEADPMVIVVSDFLLSYYGDYSLSVMLNPPTANIIANPNSGNAPLVVEFDTGASSAVAPATIVSFEYDQFGDGNWSAPSLDSLVMVQYPDNGVYRAGVRVTDSTGCWSIARVYVLVGVGYGESEDNDSFATPNLLPAFPLAGFKGSCGSRPGYTGYDDDGFDVFTFTALTGETIDLSLSFNDALVDLDIYLLDDIGSLLAWSDGPNASPEQFAHTFTISDQSPFYIAVSVADGGDDYTIDASLN